MKSVSLETLSCIINAGKKVRESGIQINNWTAFTRSISQMNESQMVDLLFYLDSLLLNVKALGNVAVQLKELAAPKGGE